MWLRRDSWSVVAIGRNAAGLGVNLCAEPLSVEETAGPEAARAVRRVTDLAPFGCEIEVGVIGRRNGPPADAASAAGSTVTGERDLLRDDWVTRSTRCLVRFLERVGVTLPLLALVVVAVAAFPFAVAGDALPVPEGIAPHPMLFVEAASQGAAGAAVSPAGGRIGLVRAASPGPGIRGTVRNSAGAAIPGVSVCLTSVERGVVRTVLSDEAGRFQFGALASGAYMLRAELDGFETYTVTGIRLSRSEGLQLEIVLQTASPDLAARAVPIA